MGRITIFSADGCPHSRRTKVELQNRGIPYVEISVTRHPKKRQDMLILSDRLSTPQVFFNTRHVGDADDTIALLKEWDSDRERRYKTALDRFEAEIASQPDPLNPKFSIPEEEPAGPHKDTGPLREDAEYSVILPENGFRATVRKVTETLKRILPSRENKHQLTLYRNSFTCNEAIEAIMKHYYVPEEDAIAFGQHLQEQQIIHHVAGKKSRFEKSESTLYRLQCYHQPDILNSYRVWTERVDSDCMRLINRLMMLMTEIEIAVTDRNGLLDFKKASKEEAFTVFEEAVCELQGVDLPGMNDRTKTAFGINLYNLMIKYAFIKVGVAPTDFSRFVFYNAIKFNVGGYVFSFQDWENGILRGNRKAPYVVGLQFSKKDPRLDLTVRNPDGRLHFGLNCGARSCPPVNNYTVENLDEELQIVATAFCEDDQHVLLSRSKMEIKVSKIFQWYLIDFVEKKKDLPKVLIKYLRGIKRQKLEKMMATNEPLKVVFSDYDWSTNSSTHSVFNADLLKPNKGVVKGMLARRKAPPEEPTRQVVY